MILNMNSQIGHGHPLRQFFDDLVRRRFFTDVRLRDLPVVNYVAVLLTDFVRLDNLYRIRNARGQPLDDVGEMLIESNPMLAASSFDREREVRKHIGDYTLFLTGLFPESVATARRRQQFRSDAFVDYIEAGKESYAIVSSFDQFEYREEAPLFRRLSANFELCVYGLNLAKQDLERFQEDWYRRVKAALGTESGA